MSAYRINPRAISSSRAPALALLILISLFLGSVRVLAQDSHWVSGKVTNLSDECDLDVFVMLKETTIDGIEYPPVDSKVSSSIPTFTFSVWDSSTVDIWVESSSCYSFQPTLKDDIGPILGPLENQDFDATLQGPFEVSGFVRMADMSPLVGESVRFVQGAFVVEEAFTDTNGFYSTDLCCDWEGAITVAIGPCSKLDPPQIPISNPLKGPLSGKDFEISERGPFTISGTVLRFDDVPIQGARITGFDPMVETDVNGHFVATAPCGWSGVVEPSYNAGNGDFNFYPARNMEVLLDDTTGFDFTGWTAPPSVELIWPDGGQNLRSGDRVVILWRAWDEAQTDPSLPPARTELFLYFIDDNGEVEGWPIAENLLVDANGLGRYIWRVPPAGNTAPELGQGGFGTIATHKIKAIVRDSDTHVSTDESDAFFTIEWIPHVHDDDEVPIPIMEKALVLPSVPVLGPAVPNPFNPRTTLQFSIPEPMDVTVEVYDVAGRLVRTIHDGVSFDRGVHDTVWNGDSETGGLVSGGIYFVVMTAADVRETVKVMLLK